MYKQHIKGSGAKMLVRNIDWQFPLHFYLMKLSQTIYEYIVSGFGQTCPVKQVTLFSSYAWLQHHSIWDTARFFLETLINVKQEKRLYEFSSSLCLD